MCNVIQMNTYKLFASRTCHKLPSILSNEHFKGKKKKGTVTQTSYKIQRNKYQPYHRNCKGKRVHIWDDENA
jgi:hypothetical protein